MNHHTPDTKLIDFTSLLAVSREYFGLNADLDAAAPTVAPLPALIPQPNQQRKNMSSYRRLAQSVLLATGLGAFLAPPVFADSGCGAMGGREAHHEHHGKKMEQHHQQLHDSLKLTPEQEPGWKKLMESEQPKPSSAGAAQREDWSKLSAPERADKTLELYKARQEHMTEYVAALKGFYATLSPEQKKIFEDMHASRRGGMRGKPGPQNPGAGTPPPKS